MGKIVFRKRFRFLCDGSVLTHPFPENKSELGLRLYVQGVHTILLWAPEVDKKGKVA